MHRIALALGFAAIMVVQVAGAALAHHGWSWTTGGNIELTGIVKTAKLGNPHGVLTMDADGEIWTVEVGQPWRNDRVGLTKEMLSQGREITVHGHRSAREGERLVKAERVVIDGQDYNLYPGRTS